MIIDRSKTSDDAFLPSRIQVPTPLERLSHPLLKEKKVTLYVKRDDLTHPLVMGNKWRKLKYNLEEARNQRKKQLVTLGGAYSNHIAATAAAAKIFGFGSVGIIRGDELNENSNPTLKMASKNGMKLVFVSRSTYKRFRNAPEQISEIYRDSYFLPEGGTNQLAMKGCEEILDEIHIKFDYLACSIGTGGTFCGLANSIPSEVKLLGFSALKGSFMQSEIQKLMGEHTFLSGNYEVNTSFHFGGYGKTTPELIDFIAWFKKTFCIQLDPIYTGKTFFGVWNMLKNGKFEKSSVLVLLHTGGLQGNLGLVE